MAEESTDAGAIYRAPQHDEGGAEAADREHYRDATVRFYTTQVSTMVVWHLLTFGVYGLFWFYQHWSVQRRTRGLPIWPFARAFFAIFYAHQLFAAIARGAHTTGVATHFSAGSAATRYVGLAIAARLVERFASEPQFGFGVGYLLGALTLWPLAEAQRLANQVDGRRPQDEENEDDDEDDDDWDEEDEDDEADSKARTGR